MNLYTKINKLVANNYFMPDVMQGTNNQIIIKYCETPGWENEYRKLFSTINSRLKDKPELYNYAEVKVVTEKPTKNSPWYRVITVTANLLG